MWGSWKGTSSDVRGGSEENQEHENSQTAKQKYQLGMASKICLLCLLLLRFGEEADPEKGKSPEKLKKGCVEFYRLFQM